MINVSCMFGKKQDNFFHLYRAEGKIKHCLVKQEGRLFFIGTSQFESLVDLVHFYETRPLYNRVKNTEDTIVL